MRQHVNRWVTITIAATLLLIGGATHAAAQESTPTQVYMQAQFGTRWFLGDVGALTSNSLNMTLTQGIQHGYIGGYLSLGSDFYLTKQEVPHAHGMSTFGVGVGARSMFRVSDVRILIGLEYSRLQFGSNSLTAQIGDRRGYNGIGGSVAGRLESMLPLYVEVVVNSNVYLDTERPLANIGAALVLGMAGFI